MTRPGSSGTFRGRFWSTARVLLIPTAVVGAAVLLAAAVNELTNGWVAEHALEVAGFAVSFTALGLAWYSAHNGRLSDARMQVVNLEAMFSTVFSALPANVEGMPFAAYSPEQVHAAFRYWNLAHTEWAATKGSRSGELQDKWDRYYALVQVSGFRHPGLQEALRQRLQTDPALRRAWHDYLVDLEQALADEAPAWLTQMCLRSSTPSHQRLR